MGTNVIREKRRVQIMLMISIAFAVTFLASFISQTAELARLERWREQLSQELQSLELQKAELDAQIALRQTDAWLSQAAVEAGLLPPSAYAVQIEGPSLAEPAPATAEAEAVASAPQMATPEPEADTLWNNPNWRAWQRLLTDRP